MIAIELSPILKSALEGTQTPPVKETAPIRSITMVGARTLGDGLHAHDEKYLKKAFSICAAQKRPVDPSVTVKVANLEYGHDFITSPGKADLVIFSYIFYDRRLVGVQRVHDYVRQSSRASIDGIWHNALLETGAQMALNVIKDDGCSELPTCFLSRAPFNHTATIHSPETGKNFALLMR